jgi:spore germination cell wall hydrolase CwlJ-like protein
MDPAALAGLCALLAHGGPASQALPPGLSCPAEATAPAAAGAPSAATRSAPIGVDLSSADARDAIARVAYAEAGNQGDSGLAAVVYTILNRLADGRWGTSVDAVLNAPHQFEPVMRGGGSWRNLRPVSDAQRARIDTILNLALDGRLPDLTNGARYFQNPQIVAQRARAGQVSARLVNFGGAAPSAVIGAHSFYQAAGRGGGRSAVPQGRAPAVRSPSTVVLSRAGGAIFVGDNLAFSGAGNGGASAAADPMARTSDSAADGHPERAIFVSADARAVGDQR